jgi:peptidoglycan/LPS O-acetylase OafA/YrhL
VHALAKSLRPQVEVAPDVALGAATPIRSDNALHEQRLVVLDGFRGLAILSVMLFHYVVRFSGLTGDTGSGLLSLLAYPLQCGWLGVELFFMISGFVILMTLEKCQGVLDFGARRFARLWPPMLVCASLTTLVVDTFGRQFGLVRASDWLTSILFIRPEVFSFLFRQGGVHWVDGNYWSLWVEVRFYALSAVLYLIRPKRFVFLLTAVYILALVLQSLGGEPERLSDSIFFVGALPYFIIGACLYLFMRRREGGPIYLALSFTLAGVILYMAITHPAVDSGSILAQIIGTALVLALFIGFALGAPGIGIFGGRALSQLGQASYSLYLLHEKIGLLLLLWLAHFHLALAVRVAVVVAIMVAVAMMIYRYVEVPCRNLVHRHTRGSVRWWTARMTWQRYRPGNAAPKTSGRNGA